MTSNRLLLIDDHSVFRTGLSLLIKSNLPGLDILEADSLHTALLKMDQDPDLILLDIRLPGLNGLEGIALIRRKLPDAPILMMSAQDDPATRQEALARGAASFLSKVERAERVIAEIRALLQAGTPDNTPSRPAPTHRQLTPRQCEVLSLLHQGFTNRQIAEQLHLAENTVRRHVQDILKFFEAGSRAEALYAARSCGMVS